MFISKLYINQCIFTVINDSQKFRNFTEHQNKKIYDILVIKYIHTANMNIIVVTKIQHYIRSFILVEGLIVSGYCFRTCKKGGAAHIPTLKH